MDWSFLWKTVLIVIVGTALLRIAGRKSVAQMTVAQTVIMVSVGTLLIQPVVGKNVWLTFLVAATMIGTLLLMEYAELKFDPSESIITGQSKILINDGQLNEENLQKLRMTVDQLEMKLRQKNISKINDVKWATLEPNGQMGFMLKDEAKLATKKDLQQLSQQINQLNALINSQNTNPAPQPQSFQMNNNQGNNQNNQNLFQEVKDKGHQNPPPDYLQ